MGGGVRRSTSGSVALAESMWPCDIHASGIERSTNTERAPHDDDDGDDAPPSCLDTGRGGVM